jgi:hypothetical protein
MVTQVNSNTFASVYKDDFNDSANFHRILFNSGRSLQARELTQMQTIIQREIQRFGNNIFKDGAAVNPVGGGVSPDKLYAFIKLDAVSNDFDGLTTKNIVGRTFTGNVSSVEVRVIEAIPANATDPATIYVSYESTPDENYNVAAPSETLIDSAGKELVVATANATGFGVRVIVAGGDFYASGHFVYAPSQKLIVSKYTNKNVNANIGYIVHEEIVTEIDDASLYDNQGVNPNRAAPGAHRYKIRLELATESSVASGQQFVKFFELVNGEAARVKTGIEDYNKPDDAAAQRTRESQGNFLVNPFKVKMLPGDSAGNLFLEVEPFTAYVDGYRVYGGTTNSSRPPYNILKPTSVTPSSDYNSTPLTARINLRNYVELDSATAFDNYDGDLLETVNLYNDTNAQIGTAKVMQYESVSNRYFAYLYNINMNDGKAFRRVDKIGSSTSNYINVLNDYGESADLRDAGGFNLFVPLLKPRIASVSDVTYEVQREYSVTDADADGIITVSSANDEPFEDEDNWILINTTDNTEESFSVGNVSITGGGAAPYQASISGITASKSYKLIAYVDKTDAQFIEKTLTSSTIAAGTLVDSNGLKYVDLSDIDIYALDSVKDSASGSLNLKSNFQLDNGQRDNGFIPGRIILKSSSLPVNSVYVKYRHFTHGAGDFYSISSYENSSFLQGDYSYSDIPVYTTTTGKSVRLADVLDFRSTYDRWGNVTREIEVPRNRANLSYNMSSYNGRIDVLLANKDKTVYVKRGVESLTPSVPTHDPIKELPLFYFNLGPNTLNPKDVRTKQIPHKRFTMKGITALENRLSKLEETVSLSLLETKTKDLVVTDVDGIVRAKSGFFVDNFQYWGQGVASEVGPTFNGSNMSQSIDRIRSVIYPKRKLSTIQLQYDSDRSTNTMLRNDTVYLKHKEGIPKYTQTDITSPKNINPFLVKLINGNMVMSPVSDTWTDTKNLPDNILPDQTVLSVVDVNGDAISGSGYNADDFAGATQPGVVNDTITETSGGTGSFSDTETVGRAWNRADLTVTMNTSTTDFTKVTDRITDISSNQVSEGVTTIQYTLPFARQKKIYFKCTALRPSTRHYPYFNGVPVAQWCREEASYLTDTQRPESDDLYDEVSPTMSEHPDGQTTLVSDTFGTITGSFFLPNTGKTPKTGAVNSTQGPENATTTYLSDEDDEGFTYEERLAAAVAAVQSGGSGINAVKSAAVYNAVGWRFRAGSSYQLEILDTPTYDVANALSKCSHSYTPGVGTLTTSQDNLRTTKTVEITREITEWDIVEPTGIELSNNPRPHDPVAQTFYVYSDDFPQGMFVNSIDTFFYSAPSETDAQSPVVMELREVRDGVPVTYNIPGAFTQKTAAQVRSAINADPATGITQITDAAGVLAAPVKFQFDEPIYLSPDAYYSFVLKTSTDKYQAWISTVGEYSYGSNTDRVSGNNIDGSLFESQNASTWSPLQNSDLAYRINHLRFVTDGTARFRNKKLPRYTFGFDNALSIDSGSNRLVVNHPAHGFFPGDYPQILGLDSNAKYAGILGSTIMDSALAVDSADAMGYTLVLDSAATDSAEFGPSTLSSLRNVMYEQYMIDMVNQLEPPKTSFTPSVKLISGQSYASSVDTRFTAEPNFSQTEVNKGILLQEPKMIVNDSASLAFPWSRTSTPGGESFLMNVFMNAKQSTDQQPSENDGTYTKTISPAIDVSNVNVKLTGNMIDNQEATAQPSLLINTAVDYVAETNPLSGSTPSKHITKPVIISEPAIALKILFDAYRPPEADFDVYYRICQADENIYDFSWVSVEPIEKGYPAPHQIIATYNELSFKPYEYFAGDETGVTPEEDITSFTQFQVKIVMKSKNTAQFPSISNVRIISLAT